MRKFCDLDLERFKVIQGQRSWCQSIAQGWFYIRLPLTPSWYLSLFHCFRDIHLTLKLFFHRRNGENVFHFWFGGHASFGFPPKTIGNYTSRDSILVASLMKIGGGLRPVERLTRFMWQIHSLTHWMTDTHTQRDFIICSMLLIHRADSYENRATNWPFSVLQYDMRIFNVRSKTD